MDRLETALDVSQHFKKTMPFWLNNPSRKAVHRNPHFLKNILSLSSIVTTDRYCRQIEFPTLPISGLDHLLLQKQK